MKKWFKNNVLYIVGAFVGAIAGYLYYHQVGCVTGTCLITSKPILSTIYGALMGTLLFAMFRKESFKTKNKLENDI
jgi:uncharacterized membrane protein YeaQ/YmgE (transglycosylase-associated protein family)